MREGNEHATMEGNQHAIEAAHMNVSEPHAKRLLEKRAEAQRAPLCPRVKVLLEYKRERHGLVLEERPLAPRDAQVPLHVEAQRAPRKVLLRAQSDPSLDGARSSLKEPESRGTTCGRKEP